MLVLVSRYPKDIIRGNGKVYMKTHESVTKLSVLEMKTPIVAEHMPEIIENSIGADPPTAYIDEMKAKDSHINEDTLRKQPESTPRLLGRQATNRTSERSIEGRDSVSLYLEEISKIPLLDAAQEVELSKAIEAGLYAEQLLDRDQIIGASNEELEWIAEQGKIAKDLFVRSNLRLVVSLARKYIRSQMPMLDLIQEGNSGLIRAVEKFDYTKGYKFSTYATWWIRQAITRGIAQQARMVRLPVRIVEQLNQVDIVSRNLEKQLGREPEPQEIAAELDIDVNHVMDLQQWGKEHTSLDAPVDDGGETSLGDLICQDTSISPDDTFINQETLNRVHRLISMLDERSADIIRSRYGMNEDGRVEKLADIGAQHGVSAERIRQLEREAIQKLRRLAEPDLLDN